MTTKKRIKDWDRLTALIPSDDVIPIDGPDGTRAVAVAVLAQLIGQYLVSGGLSSLQTNWSAITDKPLTFPPSVHGHLISEVAGLTAALAELLPKDGSEPMGGNLLFEAGQTAILGKDGTGSEAVRGSQLVAATTNIPLANLREDVRFLSEPPSRRVSLDDQDGALEGVWRKSASVALSGAQTIPNLTYQTLFWTHGTDSAFMWRPDASTSVLWTPPGARTVEPRGYLRFASNASGARIARLLKNGVAVDQIEVQAVSGGTATAVPIIFGEHETVFGDYFELQGYQASGGDLDAVSGRFGLEVVTQTTAYTPLRSHRIFQDSFDLAQTFLGGYEAMLSRFAQFGVLALSHLVTIGAGSAPWLGTPPTITTLDGACPGPTGGVIVDTGWPLLPQFLRDLKARNPRIQIFIYLSPAMDNPAWTTCGNTTTPTTQAMGYVNTLQWASAILADQSLPIDGLFLDHFNSTFMTSGRRDDVAALFKSLYGKRLMCNVTAQSVAALEWLEACPYLGKGDRICVEGFYRDGGADVSATTSAFLSAMRRLKRRGIHFDAVCEQASLGAGVIYAMNNSDIDNINGRSLWELEDWPWDTWDYNRASYAGVHPPGI